MRQIRHHRISDQVSEINAVLRGHYAYYGVAGNIRALFKYRAVERYWHRMLCTRSWAGSRLTWDTFNQINSGHRCCDRNCASLIGSCRHSRWCESTIEERGAVNPHATFCGNWGRVTASTDPVGWETERRPMALSYRAHPRLYRGRRPSLEHQPGRLSGGTAEAAGNIVGQAAAAEVDPQWKEVASAARQSMHR